MGTAAVRVCDTHVCPLISGAVPHVGGNVLSRGEPSVQIGAAAAARAGDAVACIGPPNFIARGSPSVSIGGRQAARVGDATTHGGTLTSGCTTVIIGDAPTLVTMHGFARSKRRHDRPAGRKTDPAVLRRINETFKTKIDFAALARWEGGQQLRGYVPPAGRSGVTIATGVDIGQVSRHELIAFGLPRSLEAQLLPYVNQNRQTGSPQKLLDHSALLISEQEADLLDEAWHASHLKAAIESWDRGKPLLSFRELSVAQQTVVFSRTYHQGRGMPNTAIARRFYRAAHQGDWLTAEEHLRNYKTGEAWYRSRVCGEADFLRRERLGLDLTHHSY